MDFAPVFYALLMLGFFIMLMRLRKIVVKDMRRPRIHRTTYRQD